MLCNKPDYSWKSVHLCAMRRLAAFGLLTLLVTVLNTEARNKSSLKITSKCLGNIMRVDVGPLGAKFLEVAAVTADNSSIFLSPRLAAQCGFGLMADQLGNVVIYASLQNCFAQNVEDKAFTTTLSLRLLGNRMDEDELFQVAETCHFSAWASREIVCNHNYMEVSVKRASRGDYLLPNYPVRGANSKFGDPRPAEKRPGEAAVGVTTLVFFTPEERMMKVSEALNRGYGLANTPSRLVLRSPKVSPETYIQNVAGVPMTVLRTSTVFERKWLTTKTDAAAACPLLEGSVFFTPNAITCYLPWRVDPLVSSDRFRLLEVHVGVGGRRLSGSELAARRISVSVDNTHVVVQIPVGAFGGYVKSRVQDGRYFTTYTIEPMVELLWAEGAAHQDTRYKVLFPVTTPLLPQRLQVLDRTVPEEQRFKVVLGPLGTDVALVNVTFPSEVLSVSDCIARGFNVMEHVSPNSSSRIFTLEVPFTDPAVWKLTENGLRVYRLQLTFGLLVLPEFAPFSHTAYLEAKSAELGLCSTVIVQRNGHMKVPPFVSGSCDHQNFHVLVEYGTQGFHATVGNRSLTSALALQYGLVNNATHLSLLVPFSAPDVAFQAIEGSYIKGRLDVILRNPDTNAEIQHFSMTCNFPSTLTECFPNGTMTTWAVKLDLIPSLNTSQLTLRDPSCGPSYSDERLAYFVFTADSCGTTRKFLSDAMVYENEISLPDELEMKQVSETDEPVYELKVSCYYDFNPTQAVAFRSKPLVTEPYAENTKGEFQVALRIALDKSYRVFYGEEDYPITKYLQQPLYLELELMRSTNPRLSLEVENCWATQEDRMSLPRWDLIVEGCANQADPYPVAFHPVWADARVRHPSHFKRFEVQMFAFAENQPSASQLFVHCDVVICDANAPLGGVCNRQCPNTGNKGHKRSVSHVLGFKLVSSGPIKV